jgi:hypothetical protein
MDSLLSHAILFAVLGVAFGGWFVFMTFFPQSHSRVTTVENTFWVKRGLVSQATAEKVARIEQGIALKVVYAIITIMMFALAVLLFRLHQTRTSSNHAMPFRPFDALKTCSRAQGPELAEGERTPKAFASRLADRSTLHSLR